MVDSSVKCFIAATFYLSWLSFADYVIAKCREEVVMSLRSSHKSRIIQDFYKFEHDTEKCDKVESMLISSEAPFCDPHDLNITFSSIAVFPDGINMLPYILLNVSIRVSYPLSSIFLRMECLQAPDLEDDYCYNHEEQYRRWGRMIWPCRFLTISEPSFINYPYFLSYRCFRLFSYSHYRLNVSCAPNLCRKSFIVTIPEETQVHPAIGRFYDKDSGTDDKHWSPLASVDLSLRDKVVIRYERHPSLAAARISVAVFETISSTFTHLFTDTLDASATEYEWKNVPAGNFTAYLYVNRIDCELMCIADTVGECVLCPSTKIHFTVQEDKIWFSISKPGLSYGVYILGAAILCFAIVITFLAFLSIIRYHHNSPLREISLSQRTTVFIVYTDDCKPHSDCIAAFSEMLQRHANVDVFIDQFELKYSETIPLRWFLNKFTAASHVVLIFSEGANAIFHGGSLIQQQPFPEFFSTALDILIMEYRKDVARRPIKLMSEMSSRFAFAHLTYSPSSVIPEELASLSINIFKLPDQVQNLISWLHNQPADINVDVCIDVSHLKNAINKVMEYRRNKPLWLTDRLQTNCKNFGPVLAPQNVPFEIARSALTLEEQVHIAESLNLEPPDIHTSMEEISKEETRFALIGSPDDNSFDTDDSDSDGKHLQQFLTKRKN